MKVTIAGAGVAGSYLARLIHDRYPVQVFDAYTKRGCRCAWGSTRSLLEAKLRNVGLHLSDYVVCVPTFGYINSVGYKARDAVFFDKSRMLKDLTEGIRIFPGNLNLKRNVNGLFVNATAKPLEVPKGSTVNYMVQWRMHLEGVEARTTYVWLSPSRVGYGWAFPLDEVGEVFHVGAGTLEGYVESTALANETLKRYGLSVKRVYCGCWRLLHIGRFPILNGEAVPKGTMVSVGEAAGCVHPLTGEGILPSIESAEFLAESLAENDSLYSYLVKLEGLLADYEEAFRALETLKRHKRLGMVKVFSVLNERMKLRTKPAIHWNDKTKLFMKLVFGEC